MHTLITFIQNNFNKFFPVENKVLALFQWIPSHCNIPGNERADSFVSMDVYFFSYPLLCYIIKFFYHYEGNKKFIHKRWMLFEKFSPTSFLVLFQWIYLNMSFLANFSHLNGHDYLPRTPPSQKCD